MSAFSTVSSSQLRSYKNLLDVLSHEPDDVTSINRYVRQLGYESLVGEQLASNIEFRKTVISLMNERLNELESYQEKDSIDSSYRTKTITFIFESYGTIGSGSQRYFFIYDPDNVNGQDIIDYLNVKDDFIPYLSESWKEVDFLNVSLDKLDDNYYIRRRNDVNKLKIRLEQLKEHLLHEYRFFSLQDRNEMVERNISELKSLLFAATQYLDIKDTELADVYRGYRGDHRIGKDDNYRKKVREFLNDVYPKIRNFIAKT